MTTRELDAKRNIYFPLICQIITIICGLITPRCLLLAFGSELNGAVSSIGTFLGYMYILEGGIGGVARAALYKPIAENDKTKVGEILYELKQFYQRFAVFFVFYVLVLAVSFKSISHTDAIDATTSFVLVLVVSFSTFVQYFIGVSNTILILAEQKLYVISIVSVFGALFNTICILILTKVGCGLIVVRLVSSFVYSLKPIVLFVYVRKYLKIVPVKSKENLLKDKWVGLGQHLANFLHNNTDIVVLTVFGNLKMVAVYGVYYLVTSSIQSVASSFFGGIEALFGNMYAKEENELLNQTFDLYETMVSVISTILFGITAVMIIPFIKLYTNGIQDANYIVPTFSVLLVAASWLYCLRVPYHDMVIAAGHFKPTNAASYGEAIINIIISVLFVMRFGLVGVAAGTVAAVSYRAVFYVFYLSKHIINRSVWKFVKHMSVNLASVIAVFLIGQMVIKWIGCIDYFNWILCSVIVGIITVIVCISLNYLFFPQDCKALFSKANFSKRLQQDSKSL